MNSEDIGMIIEDMDAAGCGAGDIARIRAMHEAGLDREILNCLKRCRCDLLDELHEAQRRIDRMDRLIYMTQKVNE